MPAKHLAIGLDGLDVNVVHDIGEERLPNLFSLMKRGVWSRQQSVMPPATLPNWTTFLTGVNPGRHGVIDFTSRQGYRVRFTGGTVREAPTLAARLDAMGKRCACVAFPATYPPERLKHGLFISGWDAPVAFEDDPSFVWPPALHGELKRRFGATRFDDVDEFDADAEGWHDTLPAALKDRVAQKTQLGEFLLGREQWDLFAIYFGESDTVAHHLWAHFDADSPRHLPEKTSEVAADGLAAVYEALDQAVGRLIATAGPDVEATILSDHGSGGASDRVLYLNRALAEAGLLSFRATKGLERLRAKGTSLLKDAALTLLPPRVRQRLFEFRGALLPSLLESGARFGAIDMKATRAFSDELNYFPGVWLNQRGREPDGTVDPGERDAVLREVETALLALRDPWSGSPVVETVWRRDELFEGPYLDRIPDLLLRLHLCDGYSYNLMPSAGAPPLTGPWRRLSPDEYHGRKGRSLAGSHRDHGFYLAAGPQIAPVGEIESTIGDAAATLLARMGVAPPTDASGRVLFEAFQDIGDGTSVPLPSTQDMRGQGTANEAAVEKRLRALGYIE